MSWAKQNKFLAGYSAVVGALFVVLAAVTYFAYSKWSEASEVRQKEDQKLTALQSSRPYPNADNLEDAKKRLAEDEAAAAELLGKIREKYDFPLPDISANDWAQDLNTRLEAVKNSASVNDVQLYDGFFLGMRAYAGGAQPSRENLPELSFQVAAIDALVSQLISSGVTQLKFMDREKLPGEPGYVEPEANRSSGGKGKSSNVVKEDGPFKKYSVELLFETGSKGRGLDILLSRIASHPKFFFTIRLLRIENELQLAPKEGDSVISMTAEEKKMIEDAAKSNNPVFPKVRIQGREKLMVYAVIDIIRFNEDEPPGGAPANTARTSTAAPGA